MVGAGQPRPGDDTGSLLPANGRPPATLLCDSSTQDIDRGNLAINDTNGAVGM
jgi:hypothetical protein